VVATAKHLIGNEQEHFRQIGEAETYGFNITQAISSNIDDRTMHELYLWPFADAVRANVGGMSPRSSLCRWWY
jgi:beta-glucosidase